jgi:hypothetical protein
MLAFWALLAKLLKATTSFVMSVRLSVNTEQLGTARIFMKFGIWEFLENL